VRSSLLRGRRTLIALLAAAAGVLALAGPAVAAARPDVLVVETDDQTVSDLAAMPHTRELIGAEGVAFSNSFVSLSQCCPSRATFLTGRYAHNHGVMDTTPPFGGFTKFDPSESLALWLQRAGYATGLVGKYFNGYAKVDRTEVPPGWTEWHGLLGPATYQYFNFGINDDGVIHHYGFDPTDYQTDQLTARAESFIRRRAPGRQPFFLWTTYVAPHVGSPHELWDPPGTASPVPAPRHWDLFTGWLLPRAASFNEADVSDKPSGIRDRPRLSPARIAALQETWQQRLESLQAVDEGVVRLVRALRETGALSHTLIIFTSDNGWMTGQHRVPSGKVLPYEPSIRVPLLMRGPGIPVGETRRQLVWNGDLAPTILAATGAKPAWEPDGMSLLPFIRDPGLRSRRAIVLEGPPAAQTNGQPRFSGLRTTDHVYVEHVTGERELYDLRHDPDELDNLAGRPEVAALQAQLSRRLHRLETCEGAACRR
jgi:N-acetylglucosamine-6-sulfatase